MSMNATFIQIEQAEVAKLEADPAFAEGLFMGAPTLPPAFANLNEAMQARVRAAGPKLMADAMSRLDPSIRKQLEERLGNSMSVLASGGGGDAVLRLMQERIAARGVQIGSNVNRPTLSLDKEWHGVHYLLCGQTEPGDTLLSRAVLGGAELGDDEEGFSGYGPARVFTAKQVASISEELSRPELESEAAGRFDAARMSQLQIYPGWRESDSDAVMDALRRLRDFYADAARNGRAIVTCLV